MGVRRVNLPDFEDYDEKMQAMAGCETLELGLNEQHEAACAMYISHQYNPAVVDNFFWGGLVRCGQGSHDEGSNKDLGKEGLETLPASQSGGRPSGRPFRWKDCQTP
jgi:hypothetical protein